jgi:hypothetical protein
MDEAEVHRELRRKRTRHQLREGEALLVVGIGNPLARIHQVSMHVTGERDRPSKAERA